MFWSQKVCFGRKSNEAIASNHGFEDRSRDVRAHFHVDDVQSDVQLLQLSFPLPVSMMPNTCTLFFLSV